LATQPQSFLKLSIGYREEEKKRQKEKKLIWIQTAEHVSTRGYKTGLSEDSRTMGDILRRNNVTEKGTNYKPTAHGQTNGQTALCQPAHCEQASANSHII